MTISVNGTGYTSEIYKDLVSAFNALQEGEVSVLSQVCLIEPVEPDHSTYITIGVQTGATAPSTTQVDGGCRGVPPHLISFLPTRNPVRYLALHLHLWFLHGTPAPGSVCCLLPIPRAGETPPVGVCVCVSLYTPSATR